MKKKVAILGSVQHNALAPYDDESFEIWGINDIYTLEKVKRWDRWFQLHHPLHYVGTEGRAHFEEMLQQYAKWECPVYLYEKHHLIPNSRTFPYQKLVDEFGGYFNNTISWMIAFAMHEGFKEIHLYGVDMGNSTEYGSQRPSCEYFLGLARGRGIKVYVPPESMLLKTKYLYGFQGKEEDAYVKQLTIRKEQLMQKYDRAAAEEENRRDIKNQYFGAIRAVEELMKEI